MNKHLKVHISDSLDHNEWEILRSFCGKAQRLIKTKFVSSNQKSLNGKIKWEEGQSLQFETSLPPEEQIAEFLLTFRFFYLKKEETHLPKIINILGKHTVDPEARQALKLYRKQWESSLFDNAAIFELNGEPITTPLLLDLWFNAHYFHSDKVKNIELEKIKSFFTEDFAKFMLLDATYGSSKIVIKIYRSIREIVDKYNKK